MKQFYTFLLVVALSYQAHAQVSVTTDGSSPDASAMLDVKSTNKGMLVPRMTTINRTAIAAPADGLMVYDTDTKSFWFFKAGTGWVNTAGASLWAANGTNIHNANSGNVGINTNTPSNLLTIRTNAIGLSQENADGSVKAGFYTNSQNAWVQTHTKTNLSFTTNNGSTRMVLDTLNNVGIGDFGAIVPAARLDVRGNNSMGNSIYVTNPNNTGGALTTGVSGVYSELTATSGGGFSAALRGINRSTTNFGIGVVGYQAGSGWGVYGESPAGNGVYGRTSTGVGGYFFADGSGSALFTSGKIFFTGNNEAAGRVLTSNVGGQATWQDPVSPSANTGFKVFKSGSQVINNAATLVIPFSAAVSANGAFDDGSNFDNTNNSYVAPANGYYMFTASVSFDPKTATGSGNLELSIDTDGFLGNNTPTQALRFVTGDVIPRSMNITIMTKLAAGEKVFVRVYHSLPGTVTVSGSAQFTGVRLY